jgi:hypothetical protein
MIILLGSASIAASKARPGAEVHEENTREAAGMFFQARGNAAGVRIIP